MSWILNVTFSDRDRLTLKAKVKRHNAIYGRPWNDRLKHVFGPYISWTHFDIFVVGDDFRGECIVADDGLVLDAGEDDATLTTGGTRASAVGGCARTACARRRHCYCRTRGRVAWAAFDIGISYRTHE